MENTTIQPIKNIIFDLGGVLITFDPPGFIEKVIEPAEVQSRCHTLIFKGPEWIGMDRGQLTAEQAKQGMIERDPEMRPQVERFFQTWFDMFHTIDETVPILEELRAKGFHLYILSNYIRECYVYVRKKFRFFDYFEGEVISSHEGYAKPEKEIYECLLQKYNLKAEECLFTDDMEVNVEGARAVGINTIRFQSAQQFREELKKRGIL